MLLLAAILLAGCQNSGGFLDPVASGRPYEVLVVMNDAMWERPAGRALYDVLDTDLPGLPQPEQSFRISHTGKQLDATMRIFRNIIEVNIDPSQFTRTKMKYKRDVFATDQLMITFNSPSEESFIEYCEQNRQIIIDFITRSEMNRLVKMLKGDHSRSVLADVQEMFGCTMYAPNEIVKSKKGKDFLWASSNTPLAITNICLYTYPYEGPETFNKEYVLAKRDSVMKANIPGSTPNMYMATDTLLSDVTPIVVHGKYAMETRGLWYMKNDMMGGPFVSHSRVDETTGTVYVVEGFVYAPEKSKRIMIRRLEGSLYTLMLPCEVQKALADEAEADSTLESK